MFQTGVTDMQATRGQVMAVTAALVLSAGCTGTDVLDTGNELVVVEVVVEGSTAQSWECVNQTFQAMDVRLLDGECSPASANPGAACLVTGDCPGGDCVVPDIQFVVRGGNAAKFNLTGQACAPAFGKCQPMAQTQCTLGQACTDPGDSCVPDPVAAPPFQFAPVVLPAGHYAISRLEVASPRLYDYGTGQILGDGGACLGDSPLDVAAGLGYPQFTITGSGEPVRLVVDLPALETELSSTCDYFGKVSQFLSVE